MTSAPPPLDQPFYGAPLPAAFARFFRKYGVFSGRASRAEFWWWALIWFVVIAVLQVVENSVGGLHASTMNTAANHSVFVNDSGPIGVVIGLVWLGTIVPFLALGARRLHDANMSGLLLLLLLIPALGIIVVLILALMPSRPEGQRFDRYPQPPVGYGQAPYGSQWQGGQPSHDGQPKPPQAGPPVS